MKKHFPFPINIFPYCTTKLTVILLFVNNFKKIISNYNLDTKLKFEIKLNIYLIKFVLSTGTNSGSGTFLAASLHLIK